jgi:uncharacterized membrane protein YiaA
MDFLIWCVGFFNLFASLNEKDYYDLVGVHVKVLFPQFVEKNILSFPTSDEINKFIKHLASINDKKLDRHTEKLFRRNLGSIF